MPCVVVHTFNPNSKGTEAGGFVIQGYPGLHETPFQKKQTQKLSFYTLPQIVSLKLFITRVPTPRSRDPIKFLYASACLSSLKSLHLTDRKS